jgi:hypothetical protein
MQTHNPLLIVTTVMSKEEIEMKETIFRFLFFCAIDFTIACCLHPIPCRGLLERSKSRLIEAVKAFVPPADPLAEDVHIDSKINVQISKPSSSEMKVGDRSARDKRGAERIIKKKSTESLEERPKSSQSRPGSAQVLPKRKIGATTSEPKLTTPRNGNQIGVGFDFRTQRLATKQDTKALAQEISSKEVQEEVQAMRDDEAKVNAATPLQRKGVQSCEEKKVKNEEDDESIQWKEIAPAVVPLEAKGNENPLDVDAPLSTLDTAMDWQQVQNMNFLADEETEERDDDEEEVLYSPRSKLLSSFSWCEWTDNFLSVDIRQSLKLNMSFHLSAKREESH